MALPRGDRRSHNDMARANLEVDKWRQSQNASNRDDWITNNRSVYEDTCYPKHCSTCRHNPITCCIATETRMVDKFGKNWHQDYSRYLMDPSTNGVGG